MTTSPVMTITAELLADLQQKAEGMRGWPNDRAFAGDDHWCVGTVDEEDNEYPVVEVHPDWYDQAHHGEQMARYYAAANPATILAMVEHIRSLTKRLAKVEKDAGRYAHLKTAWDEDKLISYLDSCVLPSNWDAVIDAAIAQEGADHE